MIALFTDSHFGISTSNTDHTAFDNQIDYYKKIFFPYLLENNIRNVLFLGDLLHHRENLDIYIHQVLSSDFFDFFEKNDIKIYLLIGNHDMYNRTGTLISYIQTLKKYENIIIVDNVSSHIIDGMKIGFIPFGLEDTLPDKDCKLLCLHAEIDGKLMNKFTTSKNIRKDEYFKDYKLVASGHYHIASISNNIRYLGTPYQCDRNDYGVAKYVYTFDGEVLNSIENTYSPKYIKVNYYEKENLRITIEDGINEIREFTNSDEAKEVIKNNIADIYIHEYKNRALLDDLLNAVPNKREQNYEVLDELEKAIVIEENNKTQYEICREYISQLSYDENEIEIEILLEKFTNVYNSAEAKIGMR